MKPISIPLGARLVMRKPHPCSGNIFTVKRVGADLRLVCNTCGKDLMLPREKVEKMIKTILPCEPN